MVLHRKRLSRSLLAQLRLGLMESAPAKGGRSNQVACLEEFKLGIGGVLDLDEVALVVVRILKPVRAAAANSDIVLVSYGSGSGRGKREQ
jgi:hypothetical protein